MSKIGWKAVTPLLAAGVVAMLPATSAAGGGGCHGGATQGEGDTVELVDACFTPSVLHVSPGSEVTFVNRDPFIHNVAAQEWVSPGDLRKGAGFRATFEEEGIYPYACSYHFGMTGAIVVGDGLGAGSGRAVMVVEKATPLAFERAGGISQGEGPGSRPVGLAVTGALGLLIGAGVVGAIRRRGKRT